MEAWDRDDGEKYLAAYLVARTEDRPKADQIQSFLRETLPPYMIPAAFVFLDSLPFTNGKVDRQSLPKPGHARPELGTPYAGPSGAIETSLAEIWQEVLDIRPIGMHDNFFDLGGNSLLATQIISRVINTFRIKAPLNSLLQSPTVAEMALVIVQNMAEEAEDIDITRATNTLLPPAASPTPGRACQRRWRPAATR